MQSSNTPAPDPLTAVSELVPDKPCVIDDRPDGSVRMLTYRQFNACVNRLANGLLNLGVRPGQHVMWLGQNSLEVAAAVHAARKAGAVSVPLNYRLTDDEATFVINDSDVVVIYADAAYAEMLERLSPRIPNVRHIVIFAGPGPVNSDGRPPGLRPGQLAEVEMLGSDDEPVLPGSPGGEAGEATDLVMIYTSGTTGNPKGAVRTSTGGGDQRVAMIQKFGLSADDVYVTCGPLYHSGPGGFAAIAFAMGQTVVVQHKFGAEDWLRLIETYRCSSTFSAPTPIRMVCNLDDEVKARYDTSSMRVMIANAAPWPFALKQAYVEDFPPESLWEIYGSTEMGVNTILEPPDQLRKPGSCGKAAPLVDLVLYDDDRNLITEPNVPGELFVRSSSMFRTYHKAQAKFDADDHDGWHTVGDVAYRDEEGFYFICDRKKDMIISGGMNIYPAEIEAALEAHPEIFEVAVIGVPSDDWGEEVLAVVVANPGSSLDADGVEVFARQHLAGYKIPRRVEFMDEIPKTGSNKILKRELRKQFAASA